MEAQPNQPKYYEGHEQPVNLAELVSAERAYFDYLKSTVLGKESYTPEGSRQHNIPEIRKVMIKEALEKAIEAL